MENFKWIHMLLLLLFSFNRTRALEANVCHPCLCDCNGFPFDVITPCINCDKLKLKTIPTFSFNLTKSVKTVLIRYTEITSLVSREFQNYSNLEILYLGYNKISNISESNFDGLPKLKSLDLEENQISTIGSRTFSQLGNLEQLHIENNRVSKITETAFVGLHKLKLLGLGGNKISTIEPRTFSQLGMLEKLYLYRNRISKIPETVFVGLQRLKLLNLHSNQISVIEHQTFSELGMLEKLDLYRNRISKISEIAFVGLQRLKLLNLHSNQISVIEHQTFSELGMLEKLDLYRNRISKISETAFVGLQRLKLLYLYSNQISAIDNQTFSELGMLEKLYLHRNRISKISEITFVGLRRLKLLYLYSNQISAIDNQTFSELGMLEELHLGSNMLWNTSKTRLCGLQKLKWLNLQYNGISKVEPGTFSQLKMLEKLYLNSNIISKISETMFSGLQRLKLLRIQYNQITALESQMFRQLRMLEQLILSDNMISKISETAFDGLRKLKRLDIQNNRISKVEPGTFSQLEMLERLSLISNRITEISEPVFVGLRRLKRLLLNDNLLSKIEPQTFAQLGILEDLSLRSNFIQIISRDAFGGLISLQSISLSRNRIHSIDKKTFLHLRSLKRINLYSNNLIHIPNAFLIPNLSEVHLDIKENPFKCSCEFLNQIKQLMFKVLLLIYKKDSCSKISRAACEEKRNFALGMTTELNCFTSSFTRLLHSGYNITDGNPFSLGYCDKINGCPFYLRIRLPGVITVTNVFLKLQLPENYKVNVNINIEVGDKLIGQYSRCANCYLTATNYTSLVNKNNSCEETPHGRDVLIKILEESWYICFHEWLKFYEVIVNGYEKRRYNLWSTWNQWQPCSKSCGNGSRRRNRTCVNRTSLKCLLPGSKSQRDLEYHETGPCNLNPCVPIVYQWTIGGVVGAFILVIFAIVFWYRKFKMITYLDGLRLNPNFEMDPNRTLLEQIEELPYDLHWEFPRYDVKFGSVIDEGHFGRVWLAKAKGIKAFNPRDKSDLSSRAKLAKLQDQRVHDYFTTVTEAWLLGDCDSTHHYDVAIKTLKECATPKHEKDLVNELKLLIYMGRHPNIVNVLASCTIRGDLWVIYEYCDYGCLKKFLSDRRHTFTPAWSKQSADMSTEICFFDLLRMCEQISKGLMFLYCWNVVHRDISARNVLINANFHVKIADFGLARSDGFIAAPDDVMPIKWSAIESLLRHEYSLKSDIWSTGVLFWEIFSLGEIPYPGMTSKEVIQQLKEGYRMDPPEHCPQEIWSIVLDCWQTNPDHRPTATELFQQLDEVKVSMCTTPDGQYYGTSVNYEQAGTVQGPSLQDIIESKYKMEFDEEKATFHTAVDTTNDIDDDVDERGPSIIACNKCPDIENKMNRCIKRLHQLEKMEAEMKHIIERTDVPEEIRSIFVRYDVGPICKSEEQSCVATSDNVKNQEALIMDTKC